MKDESAKIALSAQDIRYGAKLNKIQELFKTVIDGMDSLDERNKDIAWKRLLGFTLESIAKEKGLTRERIRQREAYALRRLRHPTKLGLLAQGYKVKLYKFQEGDIENTDQFRKLTVDDLDKVSIEVLDLPYRLFNALTSKNGLVTLGDIKTRIRHLYMLKQIGPKGINRIKQEMEKYYGQSL